MLDEQAWTVGEGCVLHGGYEIEFGPIKRGGRNFIQAAKVELTVNVSVE